VSVPNSQKGAVYQDRPVLKSPVLVILLTAAATVLRYALNPLLGFRTPLLFHVFAAALASQLAGTTAGLCVTGLSVILIDYFFMPPIHTLGLPSDSGDRLALFLFAFVGLALSLFGGQRKRSEDDLRRIRANLETAQEIGQVGSWESDVVGRLWWSTETYRIFGVEPGTSVSKEDFYDCVHRSDREIIQQAANKAIATNTPYDLQHRIVRRSDGEVRYVHQRANVIHDAKAVRLIGTVQDLTDLRRGELAQQILVGLLEVCSNCRNIRDSERWTSMESYLLHHGKGRVSHGLCDQCARELAEGL